MAGVAQANRARRRPRELDAKRPVGPPPTAPAGQGPKHGSRRQARSPVLDRHRRHLVLAAGLGSQAPEDAAVTAAAR